MIGELRCIRDGAEPGSVNMALDEVLLESVMEGRRPAALRFYRWAPPCLSLGYFQQERSEIRIDLCRREGIDVVRRITGGRAILHDREITYSFAAAATESVLDSFRAVNDALLRGLRALGMDAALVPRQKRSGAAARNPICFLSPSWYEIAWRGRKLLGSAQARRGGSLLQHGSLPLSLDRDRLVSLFNGGESAARDAYAQMASLEEACPGHPPHDEIVDSLVEGFRAGLGVSVVEDLWSPDELARAAWLARGKYRPLQQEREHG